MISPVTDAERESLRERPRGLGVMRQSWHHLGFLHWTAPAAALAARLPPGLDLDTFEGRAYVGIVPFTITGTRPPLLPALPGLGRFHEVNLRTYVHRGGRAPGVWFFSLDAASRLAVAGARLAYKLPYFYGRMTMVSGQGRAIAYEARRVARGAAPAAHFACRYGPAGEIARGGAAPGSLEFFLAERYLLYAWDGRRLRAARVHHAPYPLQAGAAADVSETLMAAAGLPAPAGSPLVHYARRVDVRIYGPRAAPQS